MSKTHIGDPDFDVEASLQDYLHNRKPNLTVSQPSTGVDLFADAQPVKKKTFLQRLLAHLSNPFSSKRSSLT